MQETPLLFTEGRSLIRQLRTVVFKDDGIVFCLIHLRCPGGPGDQHDAFFLKPEDPLRTFADLIGDKIRFVQEREPAI